MLLVSFVTESFKKKKKKKKKVGLMGFEPGTLATKQTQAHTL